MFEGEQVISDICKRMGAGMAEFITKEVLTVKDYDQYCHYAAGLVGEGLSRVCPSPLTSGPTATRWWLL